MFNLFMILPVELQDIILRYAGIYFAKTNDQLLFNADHLDIRKYLDQIIDCDNVEALQLLLTMVPLDNSEDSSFYDNIFDDNTRVYNCHIAYAFTACQTNMDCLNYLTTTYPHYVINGNGEFLKTIIANTVRNRNLQFFTILKANDCVPFSYIMKSVRKHDDFEFFQDLCQSVLVDDIEYLAYSFPYFLDQPRFLDYMFDLIDDEAKMTALVESIYHVNLQLCMYLIEKGVKPNINIMHEAILSETEIFNYIHQHLDVDQYSPSIIDTYLAGHRYTAHNPLAFLLQHNYPMGENVILHAIQNKCSKEIIQTLHDAGCYHHPDALKYACGQPEILSLLTSLEFPIDPETVLNVINSNRPDILQQYYTEYNCPHHPNIYHHIMSQPWNARIKYQMLKVCIDNGYEITFEIYTHAMNLKGSLMSITSLVRGAWFSQ